MPTKRSRHSTGRHSSSSSHKQTKTSAAVRTHTISAHDSFLMKAAKRRERKRTSALVVVIIAIVVIAVLVGIFSYNKIVNDKLSGSGSNAKTVLASAEENAPQYSLIKVDVGKDDSVKSSYDSPENTKFYLLMRTDTTNYAVSYILLPSNLSVTLSDKLNHPLYDAEDLDGDAELIRAVNDFAGVEINHFIGTNGEALAQLVESIGGLQITLPCELDDPFAGTQTLKAGDITLDKESALTVLRSKNIPGTNSTRATILSSFTNALLTKMSSSGSFDLAGTVEKFADTSYSDMQASQIIDFANKLSSAPQITFYDSTIAGSPSKSADNGKDTFVARNAEKETLLNNFRQGNDPNASDIEVNDFDKSKVHVEVRNGAQITGAASACKAFLEKQGYVVDKAGNAEDGTTYTETLIVYLGDDNENAANSISKELGSGRVINGGDYYTSDSGVIVIIGTDWSSS